MRRRELLLGLGALTAASLAGCESPPKPEKVETKARRKGKSKAPPPRGKGTLEHAPGPARPVEEIAIDPSVSDKGRYAAFHRHAAERLKPLIIDAACVKAFVKAHEWAGRRPPGDRAALQNLVAKLLFSTDFYRTGCDETRPPKFLVYHDPYINPCYSPMPKLT